jgi:hypothetical protein
MQQLHILKVAYLILGLPEESLCIWNSKGTLLSSFLLYRRVICLCETGNGLLQ